MTDPVLITTICAVLCILFAAGVGFLLSGHGWSLPSPGSNTNTVPQGRKL